MNGKPWWQSKTIWVNVLTMIVDVAGRMSDVIPASAQPYIASGLAILNIALRFLTDQPVTTGGK